MFSFWLGKQKNKNVLQEGVGYGGSARDDLKTFRKGREFATARQTKRDQQLVAFFVATAASLRQSKLQDDYTELVSTLKQVFTDIVVPTEWQRRMKVLVLSLTCLGLLQEQQNVDALIGHLDEPDSLASIYNNFAQSAVFIHKCSKGKDHSRLVGRILQLQETMGLIVNSGTSRTEENSGTSRTEKKQKATVDTPKNDNDPLQAYREALSRLCFDVIDSMSKHAFSSSKQSPKLNMRKLFSELSALRTSLPVEYGSSVFVRAMEDRLDLLRVLIMGPDDTPYANGCFLFDVQLHDYPNRPPRVKFLTTGRGTVRFNPNLYADGKVCLSLLGTFPGPGWIPGESTLLQVLVSIQSLIFVADPYYNEPLFGLLQAMDFVQKQSQEHNANIRRHTLRHAILPFLHGSSAFPEFRDVMRQHYRFKTDSVQRQVQQWQRLDPSLWPVTEPILRKLLRRSKWDKTSCRKAVDELEGPVRKRLRRE